MHFSKNSSNSKLVKIGNWKKTRHTETGNQKEIWSSKVVIGSKLDAKSGIRKKSRTS